MKIDKLRSIRDGQRKFIENQLEKIERSKENSTLVEFHAILDSISNKLETLNSYDEKILEQTEIADVEEEIVSSQEYNLKVEVQIRELRAYSGIRERNSQRDSEKESENDSVRDSENYERQPDESSRIQPSAPRQEVSSFLNVQQAVLPNTQSQVSSFSTNSSHFHRLPKLSLPTFDGNILQWQTFWDSFHSTVHTNPNLTDVQKFNYLRSQLENDATRTIEGFALTNANYAKAVDLLQERFGQVHKITHSYMQALLQLSPPSNTLHSLRNYYDKLENYIRGLESLGQCQDSYGTLLVSVIFDKLPTEIRKNLARQHKGNNIQLQELRKSIAEELNIMEAGQISDEKDYGTPTMSLLTNSGSGSNNPRQQRVKTNTEQRKSTAKLCVYCSSQSHVANDCKTIKEYDPRIAVIKRKRLCFNCLGSHQVSKCKSNNRCRHCRQKHHSSICQKPPIDGSSNTSMASANGQQNTAILYTCNDDPSSASVFNSTSGTHSSRVLLKTAVAPITSGYHTIDANILFDEGSQRSFITSSLAEKLNITPTGTDTIHLASFGSQSNQVRHLETATVSILTASGDKVPVNVLIVPTIAVPLQNYIRSATTLPYLRGLRLAHPITDDATFEVQLLIGADFYWKIVEDTVIRGSGPTAVKSRIGYLLSGPTDIDTGRHETDFALNVIASLPQDIDLERFWNLEAMGIQSSELQETEKSYMSDFQECSIAYSEGKYVAKLPWKPDHPELPTNYETVQRRTHNLIRRLRQEPETLEQYGNIITEQERRGFIEEVPIQVQANDLEQIHPERSNMTLPVTTIHYIPHHAVKKDSSTTPIRIVFDCSCRMSRDHPSLNDCLQATPPEMNDLTSILVRFRLKKFAVTTDIEKAFLHVGLHENDRDVTRFLWLSDPKDPDSPLKTYRFKSVLFGAVCSPFILNATLLKHVNNNKNLWSSDNLRNDLYVDNFLSSFDKAEDVLRYFYESRDLMSQAGFKLRSWASNSQTLQKAAFQLQIHDQDKVTKVLGMRWEPNSDILLFPEKTIDQILTTKRSVLRSTSRIYDPLGLLSPVTVKAKIFLQDIWKQKYDWDTQLPKPFQQRWVSIATELNNATKIQIPRWYFSDANDRSIAAKDTYLHVFVDSSTKAYGTAAYICKGNQSTLIMAKNRVAPLKLLTLPKLELMAAVTGARLSHHLRQAFTVQKTYYWSDSQIVLHWLSSKEAPNRFSRSRVSEINNLTGNTMWRYCPTHDNPADLLTRGISDKQFINNKLWFTGPAWINDESQWPSWKPDAKVLSTVAETIAISDSTEDLTKIARKFTSFQENIDIRRFSHLRKLVRVTAYVSRFIYNCRSKTRHSGALTTQELTEAKQTWIRHCQQCSFREEIMNLCSKKPRLPIIRQLRLYLDQTGLIRCKGRIHNAPLEENTKFPILLPAKHPFTKLMIQDAHDIQLHSGTNATICQLRENYWIPRIRQVVRSVLRKCVTCRKVNSMPYLAPDSPPLPKCRVEESPPFTVTGVDYSGVVYVRTESGRESKAYICLFTCASTRAVHLELVHDLTLDSFLQAFRRFTSRRSLPRIIMSDNASTFHAASDILKKMFDSQTIRDQMNNKGIEWRFIPSRAPWFGGWWERMIGLVKTCLKKTLGRSFVTFDTLQTVLTEVEAVINDRPLTYVTSDPFEPEPLTPAHLIYGRRLTTLPHHEVQTPVDTVHNHQSLSKRVRYQHELLCRFWSRWKYDYLTSLRERHSKTGSDQQTIKPGDVVQVHDDVPRLRWKLAVVEELLPGRDGRVRAVKIRTSDGFTTRPIVKLYPLEFNERQ